MGRSSITESSDGSDNHCEVGDRKFRVVLLDNFLRRLIFPPEKLVSKFVSEGQTVADLGCGPGNYALAMAKIVRSSVPSKSGKVYAVDFDKETINRLKGKIAEHGFADVIEASVSSAASVDFIPDNSIDFVFAHGLLCCMRDHKGALEEIMRIMKHPGGTAYLSIGKLCPKSDPRTVLKEDWRRVLHDDGFNTIKEGGGLFNSWALVSLAGDGRESNASVTLAVKDVDLSARSACCYASH